MTKEIIELLKSYEENIKMAEDVGISQEELWNTLYKPHIARLMTTEK